MIVPSSAQSEPILYLLSHLSPKGQAGSALLLITLISAAQRRRRWESLPSMLKWRLVYIFFRFAANRFSVCVCSVCWVGDFSASLRKQLLGNKITELCKQTNETLEGSKSNLGLFTWKKGSQCKKGSHLKTFNRVREEEWVIHTHQSRWLFLLCCEIFLLLLCCETGSDSLTPPALHTF